MVDALRRTPGGLGSALKLFSEPLRLRILALLETEELSVGELSRALDLSQSRVSNHLRLLRDAALLRERHVGPSTFLRFFPGDRADAALPARLWAVLRDDLEHLAEHEQDRVRLEAVLRERRSDEGAFFDRLAGEWDKRAGDFASGLGRERAAVQLLPPGLVVADLGCGTGYMSAALVGVCARLVCVDRSEPMLAEAKKRLARTARRTRVEFRRGELDALPLADHEVDAAVCGMLLHHVPDLDRALSEVFRVVRPGGTCALLELAPHREAWMREALGDRHLGLEPDAVQAALRRAGFEDVQLEPVEDRYRPRRPDVPDGEPVSLSLYVVRGRSPRP